MQQCLSPGRQYVYFDSCVLEELVRGCCPTAVWGLHVLVLLHVLAHDELDEEQHSDDFYNHTILQCLSILRQAYRNRVMAFRLAVSLAFTR